MMSVRVLSLSFRSVSNIMNPPPLAPPTTAAGRYLMSVKDS